MSIKISKISYFSFSFKLNEKKVPLKNMVWRGGLQENFAGMGELIFNRGLEIFQKRGARLGVEKKERWRVVTRKHTMLKSSSDITIN